jgi:nucleoside-diphosphate-sugar epimerase
LGDALRKTHPALTKFVLIGSLASYGPGDAKTMKPIHPDDAQRPVSAYGISKQQAARYIQKESGLRNIVICPTGVYGPRDRAFLQFVKMVNTGIEPYVGFHPQRISLVYVRDLAKAVVSLMSSVYVHKTYLVSDGRSYEKGEMGTIVKSSLNKRTVRFTIPMAPVQLAVSGIDWFNQTFFKRLPFINREKLDEISSGNWLCDSSNVWDHAKLQPMFDLQSGMQETIMWYRQNKWI